MRIFAPARTAAVLCSALFLGAARAAGQAEKAVPSPLEGWAAYEVPEGWSSLSLGSGYDHEVRLSHLRYTIRIRLLGGKNSKYPTPGEFLDGFEARSLGRPPKKMGTETISGIQVISFLRKVPIDAGDPASISPEAPKLAKEQFLIVPARERYFLLSYSFESPSPDLRDMEAKAWKPFLKSFRLVK